MAAAGMDMGIGEGAQLGGSVLNSIGQMQGFRALARARAQQRAEQDLIQHEGDAETRASMANNNQNLLEANNQAAAEAPGRAYLETLKGYQPIGLSVSQQTAAAPAMEASMSDLQAANRRLAQARGSQQTARGQQIADLKLEDRRDELRAKSRRLSSMYDLQDMIAMQHGEGLRTGGNLLKAAGGAAGGMGGGAGGGVTSLTGGDGAGEEPEGGWWSSRVTRSRTGGERAAS